MKYTIILFSLLSSTLTSASCLDTSLQQISYEEIRSQASICKDWKPGYSDNCKIPYWNGTEWIKSEDGCWSAGSAFLRKFKTTSLRVITNTCTRQQISSEKIISFSTQTSFYGIEDLQPGIEYERRVTITERELIDKMPEFRALCREARAAYLKGE